jgi:O-antigen ligase
MALLLSAAAAAVALLITPGLLFYFDVTPKLGALLIGTAAAIQILAGVQPAHTLRSAKRWPRILRWFAVLIAIQSAILIISAIASADARFSLTGTTWRRFGVISQIAVLLFTLAISFALTGRPDRRRFLLRATVLAGAFGAVYGIAQYFGLDPLLPPGSYVIGEGEWAIVRPPGTFGYASYAATFYLFVVFGGIAITRMEAARAWRIAGIAATVLGSLAIVLSGTRAAVLGLITGGALLAAVRRDRVNTRGLASAAALLVCLAVLYISPAGQKVRSRVRWSLEDPRGGARLLLWRDSLRMAAERPVIGWGPETFGAYFGRFQSPQLSKLYPDFYYESPHNIFLDALISSGAAGLGSLLAICALAWYAARTAHQANAAEAAPLGAAVAASIAAQQFTVFTIPTALYLFIPIAILVAAAASDSEEAAVRRSWIGTVAAILLAAFAVRTLTADRLLARSDAALQKNDLQSAASLFRDSKSWQQYGPHSDLWYSRALAKSATKVAGVVPGVLALREGYAAAHRAAANAEDPHNAYYNLATYCALQNDPAGVEANLRQAIHWAPNWFKPHWALAKALQMTGRLGEAQKEATVAADLDGGVHREVAGTLQEIQSLRSGVGTSKSGSE